MGRVRRRQQQQRDAVVQQAVHDLKEVLTGHAHDDEFSHKKAKAERQRRLSNVGSLSDAYGNFGMKEGDRVKKRDQVNMFRDMRGSMETYLERFITDGLYDSAIDLRDRMKKVTKEFQDEMLAQERANQTDEKHRLRSASARLVGRLREHWRGERARMADACDASRADMREDHAIKREVLERDLAHAPTPRVKWSRTLLDMQVAERNLCKQHRFEEAKEERRRADLLRTQEQAAHDKWVQEELDLVRRRQQDRHAFEAEQRESNCKTAMWTTRRHAELDMGTTRDRMAHLEKDMKHAHVLDQHETRRYLGPQMMSMRPLVPKRAGHATSSSSLRGTLLSAATAEGRAAVSSLTSTHDFSAGGALTLGTAEALTMDRSSRMAAKRFGLTQGSLGGPV